MKKQHTIFILLILIAVASKAQEIIPLDTSNWQIQARSYLLENYEGKASIYLQGGTAELKGTKFLNGTIEFDVYLRKEQGFPGVYFRAFNNDNHESFYLRPHQSGNPDANQASPVINGISPWQLYFGPRYSFAYNYSYDRWTHVKIIVNGQKAQVFLDYAEKPNLSWNLVHPAQEGKVGFGGGFAAMHYANFTIDKTKTEINDFNPIERKPIKRIVQNWQISEMFEERLLQKPKSRDSLISKIKWQGDLHIDEGVAANISRKQTLFNGSPGNTVFAKIIITSDRDQLKLFDFGYSDRVVAILNGVPIYRGNNKWRSRDYRYLGTIGLFDSIYLNLKKGENTLLFAVSEDFGGWLITGRFEDSTGVKVK